MLTAIGEIQKSISAEIHAGAVEKCFIKSQFPQIAGPAAFIHAAERQIERFSVDNNSQALVTDRPPW